MDRLQVVRVVNRFNRHSESLDGHRFVDTWRSTLFFGSVGLEGRIWDGWMCYCSSTDATVFAWIIQ